MSKFELKILSYGAVVRKPGAYVPPALRKKLESETPAVKPSEPQKVKPESVAAKPTEVAPPTEEKVCLL